MKLCLEGKGCVRVWVASPLHRPACLERNLETVRFILQNDVWREHLLTHGHRANPAPFYRSWCVPLHVAIERGSCDIVEELLNHKAPAGVVSSRSESNSTLQTVVLRSYNSVSLMDPALGGKLIRLLAREGNANLEQRVALSMALWSDPPWPSDSEGTVLHDACWAYIDGQRRRDHYEAYNRGCLVALLREGADINARTSEGSSPFDIAYSNQNRKLERLLTSFNSADSTDIDALCPLANATSSNGHASDSEIVAPEPKRQRRTTPLAERARRVGVEDRLKSYDGLSGKELKAAQSANQQVVSRAEQAAARSQNSSSSSGSRKVLCTTQYGGGGGSEESDMNGDKDGESLARLVT